MLYSKFQTYLVDSISTQSSQFIKKSYSSDSYVSYHTCNIDIVTSLFAEEGFKIETELQYLGRCLGLAKYSQY